MKGKVLQTTGSWYRILCDDGQLREARLKGKFKNDKIKLLGRGELKAKLDVTVHAFSATAKSAIEANGGTATINKPIYGRPDWNEIKDILMGNKPIESIDCK